MRELIPAELRQAERLKQKHLDGFARDGIPALNLAKCWDGHYAFVQHDWCVFDDFGHFEFARHAKGGLAQSAFVFELRNAYGEVADIAAWRPPTLATWLGAVSMLGEEQVEGVRLDDPLLVHADVASWFRAKREGVYIVDYPRAARVLGCETLGVEGAAHARTLKSRLTIAAPPIVIVEPVESPNWRLYASELAA